MSDNVRMAKGILIGPFEIIVPTWDPPTAPMPCSGIVRCVPEWTCSACGSDQEQVEEVRLSRKELLTLAEELLKALGVTSNIGVLPEKI